MTVRLAVTSISRFVVGNILTAEELYWALSLLGQAKTRLVLSEQAPQVFDGLYNAFQKR